MAAMNRPVFSPCGGERRKGWMISDRYHLLPYPRMPSWHLQVGPGGGGKTAGSHVWKRASGWDVVRNAVLVGGRTKVGHHDAGELGENGGPMVMVRDVNV